MTQRGSGVPRVAGYTCVADNRWIDAQLFDLPAFLTNENTIQLSRSQTRAAHFLPWLLPTLNLTERKRFGLAAEPSNDRS